MKLHKTGLALIAGDLIATSLLFSRLPAQVATHWDLAGEPNGFGSRWELAIFGPAILLVLWILLLVLGRIDPLASRPLPPDAPESEHGAFNALTLSLMVLLVLVHLLTMLIGAGLVARDNPLHPMRLVLPVVMVLVGNFLPRVRPNYFAGLRTPWTLSSETVWRRSNRLAGKTLFAGGIAAFALLFIPGTLATYATGAILVAAIATPIIASYLFWREERR